MMVFLIISLTSKLQQRIPSLDHKILALYARGHSVRDIKETFRKKFDMEFRPYKILGACNPSLAKQALGQEPNIGLLLLCNIIVQEISKNTLLIATTILSIFKSLENHLFYRLLER